MRFQALRHRSLTWCVRSLVVCVVVVLTVGEQTVLRAGPLEDCEAAKVKGLLDCKTDRDTAEKICVNNAEAALRVCQTNLLAALDKADVDKETQLKIAFAAYVAGMAGCVLIVNPLCLVPIGAAYASALAAVQLNWARVVDQVTIDKKACDTNAATDLEKCRKNADVARAGCEKKVNDAYDDCCTKACNGG